MLNTIDAIGDQVGCLARLEAADVVTTQHGGATTGCKLECFACGKPIRTRFESGPDNALQQHRLACLTQQLIGIIAGRAIDTEADTYATIVHFTYWSDARSQNHITARTMTDTAKGLGQHRDFITARMHHVRKPDIVAGPAEALQIGQWTHTEEIFAKPILVDSFGEVGMQPDPIVSACQLLQHGATAETKDGRVVRVRLPHPPEVVQSIKDIAIKMRDGARGWSDEKTTPEDMHAPGIPPEVAAQTGATGEYPDGKARPDDEGEIAFAVGAIKEQNLVVLSFGKPLAWMGMAPADARMLADLLMKQADNVEGQNEPHEFVGYEPDCGQCGEGVGHHVHAEDKDDDAEPECTCGDLVGTYSRHEGNPDGHGSGCPKFGGGE